MSVVGDPVIREWLVEEGDDGQRLDTYIAGTTDLSRTRVGALLKEGHIRVDGVVPRKSHKTVVGERVTVRVPAPVAVDVVAEDLPLDIVYQDRELAVINKAAGMVVHPAPGHPRGTLVNALLHHIGDLSGIGGALRPGIVHRLDRDTSGLMVVAKSDLAHRSLSRDLKSRDVKRTYLAALWGTLPESPLVVDQPIGRDLKDRKKMAVVEDGRSAQTRFRHLEKWRAASLVEVDLRTGRTHQIRVHSAHIGHPVVGDHVYGANRDKGVSGPAQMWARELGRRAGRQFLHAHRLAFVHPATGEAVSFEAPLPADLAEVRAWAAREPERDPNDLAPEDVAPPMPEIDTV